MTNREDFAVVIGISRYSDLTNLVAPASDAREVASWLTDSSGGALPSENVQLLVNDEGREGTGVARPNRQDVENAFDKLLKFYGGDRKLIGRRLYIYMSGHGYTSYADGVALLMADASSESLGHAVAAKEYADHFRRSGKFKEIVLFVDCDRSIEGHGSPSIPPWSLRSDLPEASFFYAFATTRGSQAYEVPQGTEQAGGLFTRAFLEGLRGNAIGADGTVSSKSLSEFLSRPLGESSGPEQIPEVIFGGPSPIIFVNLPEHGQSSRAASSSSNPDVPFPPNTPTISTTATTTPTSAETEPEFDQVSFVSRLMPDAAAALLRAEGYRVALGQKRLHMEHLLLGLYGRVDSPIRRLARNASIYDEKSFQRSLSMVNARLTGDVTPVPQAPPVNLPTLSAHVREAFVAAQKLGGQQIGRGSLLSGALTVSCSAHSILRSTAAPQQTAVSLIGPLNWIIGINSDVPGGRTEDLLNLKRDVNALCSVIAAADAALPLSIGLFGEWGSGKSFFMNMMEQRLGDLQTAGRPAFCSRIVQLKFNAWHYMDTSLWASLTSEIFEGLATKLSTTHGPEPATQAAKLLDDLSTSRDKLAEAERQRENANAKLAESEARLQKLAGNAAEIRASLSPRILFTEATRLALEQEEVKDGFEKAAKELNLPQAVDAGAEVNKELLELRGIFSAMFVAMRNTERLWIWILALALVALAVFGIPPIARTLLPDQWAYLKVAITAAATFLAGVAAFLGPFFVPARRALKYLQEARKKSDKVVREKKVARYNELRAEFDKRKEEVDKQENAVKQEREKLEALQEAVEQLRADRQMLDFIKGRNASKDYTSHLGVVARAHKDFKELSVLLERVSHEESQSDLPRIDRIVLYIDDLDRCPEDKVMDVLQAVHLLLAFPLFVVVVGVDPRWLLHSVAARSRPLRRDGVDAEGFGNSTPLEYLEKIFQIPFTLSPMSHAGFDSLVDKLAGSGQGEKKKVHSRAAPASTLATTPMAAADKVQAETRTVSTSSSGLTPTASAASLPASSTPAIEEVQSAPEPLKIEAWESDYMKKLYCLIPSPRAGKRFINIYRMIRSTVDGADWQAFVGDEKLGGDHRQVLLLLAILTGYPGEAAEILRRLIERVHNETWWEFIDTLNATDRKWPELRLRLHSIRSLITDTEGCDVFTRYAPWVARYSFQSGRVLLGLRQPQADT